MNRILLLGAAAACLIAAPAGAQTLRVPTAGKTPSQLNADIASAARAVCRKAVSGTMTFTQEFYACVRATQADALAQLPASGAASAAKPAEVAAR